jgi:pimeloyl-ACP methyl ester carboxylesterase
MNEQFCTTGEIELCYERFGDPDDPAMVLVMGLATQMVAWHDEFCAGLAERGFCVVRFDNRDVGRSTHLDGAPPPTTGSILRRRPRPVAYTLAEMADDTAGLLDCLEVDKAHLVGVSMGGMIAQLVAANRPERVLSLTSIMSNTGSLRHGQARPSLWPLLLRPRGRGDVDSYTDRVVEIFTAIGSPGYAADELELRELARLSYVRGHDDAGALRQLGAIIATGNRTAALRRIDAPTLVIHGTADRLIAPSGGRATARAIPGARLMVVPHMGHDLPRTLWPRLIGAIADHAAAAQPAAAAGSGSRPRLSASPTRG